MSHRGRHVHPLAAALAAALLATAVRASDPAPTKEAAEIPSAEILEREPLAERSRVQHILIGWKDLEPSYRGGMDERAKTRGRDAAAQLARELLEKARSGADFARLMEEHSEDPGSAATGTNYEATPDARLAAPFKRLALRLAKGEIGAVETVYGWHILKRVE